MLQPETVSKIESISENVLIENFPLDFEHIKVEELPLTCFIINSPHSLGKNGITDALKSFTEFKRIFFQGSKTSNQPFKFFVVFENKDQMEEAIKKEITMTDPKKPNVTARKVTLIPTKWSTFNSLGGHIVCVKGLTKNISEDDLKTKFQAFGEVLKVELTTKVKGNDLKFPFAYVFFKQVEDASKAVETGKLEINNVKVDVEAYKTKKEEASHEKPEKIKRGGKPITMDECTRTLYISNARKGTTRNDLAEIMTKYGEVDRVMCRIHNAGKQNATFFQVVFADKEGFDNALKVGKLVLKKNILQKGPIRWNSLPELHPFMVKVDGLSAEAGKEDLESMFKTFGTIANIEIVKPKKRKTFIAFVFFKAGLSAQRAVSLDGTQFKGQTLSVRQKYSQAKNNSKAVFIRKPDSKEVSLEALRKELMKFGAIEKIHDGVRNFVITFEDETDTAKALDTKKVEVAGITLEMTAFKTASAGLGVLVTGLPKGTELDQVVEHFEKSCGVVTRKYIGSSKRPSGARGTYAYIEFKKQEDKFKALKLTKSKFNGKVIFVRNSNPTA